MKQAPVSLPYPSSMLSVLRNTETLHSDSLWGLKLRKSLQLELGNWREIQKLNAKRLGRSLMMYLIERRIQSREDSLLDSGLFVARSSP